MPVRLNIAANVRGGALRGPMRHGILRLNYDSATRSMEGVSCLGLFGGCVRSGSFSSLRHRSRLALPRLSSTCRTDSTGSVGLLRRWG